ncbi:MAG: hypothetical protein ABJJ37_26500 [Roseibium sp.]
MADATNRIDHLPVRIGISLAAVVMFGVKVFCPDTIDTNALILFAIGVLPWAGTFLKSFKLGKDGIEAELSAVKTELDTAKQDLKDTSETLDKVIAIEAEADSDLIDDDAIELSAVNTPKIANAEPVNADWLKVLNALVSDKYKFRTATGIAKSAKMSADAVHEILQTLKSENHVSEIRRSRQSREEGKTTPLWGITVSGRRLLRNDNLN